MFFTVAEETRVGKAVEADLTLKFTRLDSCPLRLGKNPAEILLPDDPQVKKCFIRGGFRKNESEDVLDYVAFFRYLLESISKCLQQVQTPGTAIEKVTPNFKQCRTCQEKDRKNLSIYSMKTHCKVCLTAVTQTKMGPCLIFKKKPESSSSAGSEFFVVDLIPVFPVDQFDNLKLYDNVISYLVNESPPFWLKYFNSMIKQVTIFTRSSLFVTRCSHNIIKQTLAFCNITQIRMGIHCGQFNHTKRTQVSN